MKKLVLLLITGTLFMSLFTINRTYAATTYQNLWIKNAETGLVSEWMPFPMEEYLSDTAIADASIAEARYKVVLFFQPLGAGYTGNNFSILVSDDPFTVYYQMIKEDDNVTGYRIFRTASKNNQPIESYMIDSEKIYLTGMADIVHEAGSQYGFTQNDPVYTALDKNITNPQNYGVFEITDIGSTSFKLNWDIADESVSKVQMRLLSTIDSDYYGPEGQVYQYNVEAGNALVTGLKPGTGYYMELTTINARGENSKDVLGVAGVNLANVITLKNEYNLTLKMDGKTIYPNSFVAFNPLKDLFITTTDYNQIKIFAGLNDEEIFDKSELAKTQAITIPSSEFDELPTDANGVLRIKVWAYKANGLYDQYQYNISTILDPTTGNYNEYIDFTPRIPDKPESNWDVVGWLKYLMDWLVYLVESLVWLLKMAGSLIEQVVVGSEQFVSVLAEFFSFLPQQVVAIITLGVVLAVILRVLKR